MAPVQQRDSGEETAQRPGPRPGAGAASPARDLARAAVDSAIKGQMRTAMRSLSYLLIANWPASREPPTWRPVLHASRTRTSLNFERRRARQGTSKASASGAVVSGTKPPFVQSMKCSPAGASRQATAHCSSAAWLPPFVQSHF